MQHPSELDSVLVVDDNHAVRDVVRRYLEHAGYDVAQASDGETALRLFAEQKPDLVVLDLMLPGVNGLEVCKHIREHSQVPVIMLTALGEESDRVLGLELGADDYIVKPFSPRELVLRVGSVLRRARSAPPAPSEALADGALQLDLQARRTTLGGRELSLTGREFDLLAHLMRNPGRAFSRSELLEEVWGWSFGDHSTVTVHMRRLREKIEPNPAQPRRISTVWGIGYRYDPEDYS